MNFRTKLKPWAFCACTGKTGKPETSQLILSDELPELEYIFKTYKTVDKRVTPVPGTYPEEAQVRRQIPEDPLANLPILPTLPPEFEPTKKFTMERMNKLNFNKNGFLLPEEEKLFKYILRINERCLAWEESDRGTFRDDYFSPYIIPTMDHKPWSHRDMRIPPGIEDRVLQLLRDKIDAGVYEYCQSSYRSRWFCVLKKNGKLRIVHDLQPLNQITIKDDGTPPILDGFVDRFAGRQCYTVFDLFWGFDARKLDPRSRNLTAFHTPLGTLRITSMPMGFTNSPAEFQACMAFILRDEITHVANVFIDDLPIKGPATQYENENGEPEKIPENPGIRRFIWEHAQDVHRIMHRVGQSGATFSAEKVQLCQPEVTILGQKCTPTGRLPETSTIEKILSWPTPTTVKDIRSFLGVCGVARIWVKGYSQIIRPLTELTRKDVPFEWNERRQQAFDKMKELLTTPPVLHPIDYNSERPVILAVDTSKYGVGYILSQLDEKGKKRPARYGSLPLSGPVSRYSQAKLELYGLFQALGACKAQLVGVKDFRIEVDAKYIKQMLLKPSIQPSDAMNRWIQGILNFNAQLIHVPAKQHQGPDGLSRKPLAEGEEVLDLDDEWVDQIALYLGVSSKRMHQHLSVAPSQQEIPASIHYLNTETTQDQRLRDIKRFLETQSMPDFSSPAARKRFLRKVFQHFVHNGDLFRNHPGRMPVKIILDADTRLAILNEAHSLGHRGEEATFRTIQHRFAWPFYRSDVRHFVQSCHECQIRTVKRSDLPLRISTPSLIFQRLYLDVMHMPKAKNYRYIVAARDDLTGALAARAIQRVNALTIATFFEEEILTRFGHVLEVITDNGSETKAAFQNLLSRYNVRQIRISPYNSRANGVVERGHFTLREALIKSCEGVVSKWPQLLRQAIFADQITTRRSTGFSPFRLLYGHEPLLAFDLREMTFMVQGFHSGMSHEELLALRIRQLERRPEDVARAAAVLQMTRMASSKQFERRFAHRIRKREFEPGDLVLVRNNAIEMEHNRKHKPRYLGPFEVVRRTAVGIYVVKELNGDICRTGIAPKRLLPYHPRTNDLAELMQVPISSIGGREDINLETTDTQEATQFPQDESEEDLEEEDMDQWSSDEDM